MILHANWSADRLFIWGEDGSRYSSRRGAARNGEISDAGVVTHSFAASTDSVHDALRSIDEIVSSGSTDHLTLRLPLENGHPAPSDDLAGEVATLSSRGTATLGTVEVPAIAVGAGQAFRALTEIHFGALDAEHMLGAGARFFGNLAALVAELLVEHRFLPSVVQDQHMDVHAAWTPWLNDADVGERMRDLLDAMPPIARAVADDSHHDPWSIVNRAVSEMTDAVVRDVLHQRGFSETIEAANSSDPHVALIDGLLNNGKQIGVAAPQKLALFTGVRDWIGRLRVPEGLDDSRLIIHLDEPPHNSTDWTLRFYLQRKEQQDIAVPELWSDNGEAHSAIRLDKLQESAIREIRRAGELFEPILDGISEARPHDVQLSTKQAYGFLRDAAPLLSDAGFGVVLPQWWRDDAARLGVSLELAPSAAESDGATGQGSRPSAGLSRLVGFAWNVQLAGESVSVERLTDLAREGCPLVRQADGWVEVRGEDVASAMHLIDRGLTGEATAGEMLMAANGVGARAAGLPVLGVKASGWIQKLIDQQAGGRIATLDEPEKFRGSLRGYQLAGLSWLAFLERYGLGGVLADDMGLGKTIQLIALLQHEREHQGDLSGNPTLVVAPLSVVANWAREIDRFAPELRVYVHHGPQRLTGEAFARRASIVDVIVTTYGLVARDAQTFDALNWHRVVLDEAQSIKNAPTQQARAVRGLQSDRRLALTGTPVENRLSELWSIMDFCNPGYLGPHASFRKQFAVPIERHHDGERVEALRGLIRPFILRRLKTDRTVAPDLPDLVRTEEYAMLSAEQSQLYDAVARSMLVDADDAIGMRRRGIVLAGITRLKQICNHPGNLPDDFMRTLGRRVVPESGSQATRSGKMMRLLALLEEVIASDSQALIFTQFRRMGDLLVRIIRHELDVPVLFMHGGVSAARRQELIDQFQDPSLRTPVFVLSLKAGGLGLNLTGANHVFHYDRWWNPAVENQATDRAHRIGQTRTVHVHRLICSGTLEEHIAQMIEEKSELAERIVGAGDAWLTELSTDQLRDLVTLRSQIEEAA